MDFDVIWDEEKEEFKDKVIKKCDEGYEPKWESFQYYNGYYGVVMVKEERIVK